MLIMKKIILILILLVASFQVRLFAQNNNVTVQSLLGVHIDTILKYHLAGEAVELTNGKFNNHTGNVTYNQIGSFNRNNYTQFPFETGLVMTTGEVSVAAGPNSGGGSSASIPNYYTDPVLQQSGLATATLNGCAALDFDFLAYADTFAFNYVFGSEEYPNFVCATYNDIFIFMLTGPDPVTGVTSTRNVAIVPNTVSATNPNGLPVSISTINGGGGNNDPGCYNGTYSNYFISSNTGDNGVEYNGRTVELAAEGHILACETYHMHLAIGNVGDNSYDSGVFLEGKSFKSSITTKLLMRNTYCLHEDIVFDYVSDEVDTIFVLTPHGDTIWQRPFTLHDADISDTGLYFLYAHSALRCVDLWTHDSIYIDVVNTYKPNLGEDQWLCTGESALLDPHYDEENVSYFWSNGAQTPTINVLTAGEYILEVMIPNPETHTNCRSSDTVEIHYWPLPQPDFETDVVSGCTPVISQIQNLTSTVSDSVSCEWIVFDQNFHITHYSSDFNPSFRFDEAGSYTIKLIVSTLEGCKDSITKWNYIITSPQPNIDFAYTPESCMMSETNGEIAFSAFLSDNVGSSIELLTWNFGDGQTTTGEVSTSHTYSSWGDYIVTLSLITDSGCGDSVSHVVVIEDDLIFPNVITPNGDGINDVWAIGNLNTDINFEDPDGYRTNELRISDRYGKVVFHVKNYDTYSKDGQIYVGTNPFSGQDLSDGVYYYTFTYKGKAKTTQWHGSITILR